MFAAVGARWLVEDAHLSFCRKRLVCISTRRGAKSGGTRARVDGASEESQRIRLWGG